MVAARWDEGCELVRVDGYFGEVQDPSWLCPHHCPGHGSTGQLSLAFS